MKIGFDAYFAFHYKTGVAHYSRNLINSIAAYYPETELVLFTDKTTDLYQPSFPNLSIVCMGNDVSYYDWLSHPDLISAIENERIDIFHGLDHGTPQIPGLKKVVTIHDLFFETHPGLYVEDDRIYYRRVAPEACRQADIIIAISQYTKEDLINRYQCDASRIIVCYQSCNPLFFQTVTEARKNELRKQFDLPEKFWLYVGSVTERKNLLNICKAMHLIRGQSSIPLMVIGEGGEYLQQVQEYISDNELEDRIRLLSYKEEAKRSVSFQQAKDIPAFHQMAMALVYPSLLEGFGIPLIEAFASGLPVITSRTSSLPEIAGDAALYVDPGDPDGIAKALLQLEKENEIRCAMIEKGNSIVRQFTPETAAAAVMDVYRQLI